MSFLIGTMIGFLSHLVLDELCSVDFTGAMVHLNKYAGSALKLTSASWPATGLTYLLLAGLALLAYLDWTGQSLANLFGSTGPPAQGPF